MTSIYTRGLTIVLRCRMRAVCSFQLNLLPQIQKSVYCRRVLVFWATPEHACSNWQLDESSVRKPKWKICTVSIGLRYLDFVWRVSCDLCARQSEVFQPISSSFFNRDVDVTAPDVAAQRVKLMRTKHKPTLFSDDVARCLASNARHFTGLNENANSPLYTSLNL